MVGDSWHSWGVKKTSIYLDPDIDRALARRAAAEGTTKAALIRTALAAAAAETPRPKPQARGVFAGPGDLSQDVDRYLEGTGFGQNAPRPT
jgi:predicted transcriptional regulator